MLTCEVCGSKGAITQTWEDDPENYNNKVLVDHCSECEVSYYTEQLEGDKDVM